MSDLSAYMLFLAFAGGVSYVWGRTLWYLDERSAAFRRVQFKAMGYSRRRPGEVRSLLLSGAYYGMGAAAIVLFLVLYGIPGSPVTSSGTGKITATCLGVLGAISLTNLGVDLAVRWLRQDAPSKFAALKEIPWIRGLEELSPGFRVAAGMLGGAVEELFFRGVLLLIAIDHFGRGPWEAIGVAGALFCFQQIVQLRTPFQVLVIGIGCAAISLVGGILVNVTGSVVPAVVCHASFVVFFVGWGYRLRAGSESQSMEAPA